MVSRESTTHLLCRFVRRVSLGDEWACGWFVFEGVDHGVNVVGQGVEDWAGATGGVVFVNFLEAFVCGPAGCDESNELIIH